MFAVCVIQPFDQSAVARGADGIARYQSLSDSLVAVLRATVDRVPKTEALCSTERRRLNYCELAGSRCIRRSWRSARCRNSKRGSRRYPLGERHRLVPGIFWHADGRGRSPVPVNTRFSETEVEYVLTDSGSRFTFLTEQPLPEGKPFCVEHLTRVDLAAGFYTSENHSIPERRHDFT